MDDYLTDEDMRYIAERMAVASQLAVCRGNADPVVTLDLRVMFRLMHAVAQDCDKQSTRDAFDGVLDDWRDNYDRPDETC